MVEHKNIHEIRLGYKYSWSGNLCWENKLTSFWNYEIHFELNGSNLLMLVSNLYIPRQQRKTDGKCVTQICEKSRNNFIVEYGTRHISLQTSRKYVKKGEIWKSTGHGQVELENVV